MIQIKFYGLGGQGVVTASKILSVAASLYEGKYAVTVPSYGHERRGAPVTASILIDDTPVLLSSFVYEPDLVLVMDPTVIHKNVNVSQGIRPHTSLVLNTGEDAVAAEYRGLGFHTVYYADGTRLALEEAGSGIPNGAMMGALAASGTVGLEAVEKAILDTWSGKAGESNARAARRAYESVRTA